MIIDGFIDIMSIKPIRLKIIDIQTTYKQETAEDKLLSILHFYGRFIFQMPEYNNDPAGDASTDPDAKFNQDLHDEEVYQICGCNPANYFEFIFRNVRINQITYSDGISAIEGDSIIGQRIRLNGIMTDVSPSAPVGQIFAASMKIGNLLSGKLRKAIQSDIRTNVRPRNINDPYDQENAGAHFETILDLTDKTSPEESRFLNEIGDVTQLEFYMHTNRYTIWNTKNGYPQDRLNGDVYGYIRTIEPQTDNNGLRMRGRRLVAHPDMKDASKEVAQLFLGTTPLTRNTDIDGTYDISKANRLLMLRYLDFVPLLDRDHKTPTTEGIVKEYLVSFTNKQTQDRIEVGSFKGDHSEMKKTGGLVVFKLSNDVLNRNDLMIVVDVIRDDKKIPLMIETEWDLVLESERGLTIPSGHTADVTALVYHLNRPAHNCSVRLLVQPSGEMLFYRRRSRRSPIVAKWQDKKEKLITDMDGRVNATVEAIDLENSQELYDPIKEKNVKGELDWDRYYGNYVYMEINNDLRVFQYRAVEQIEISVRVLHVIKNLDSTPPNRMTFEDYIFPKLLKYYVRYFPWLHTFQRPNDTYVQFLNLESYEEVSGNIQEIIRRLSLDDNEWDKMPRSRDFPIGGVELIKRWLAESMPR